MKNTNFVKFAKFVIHEKRHPRMLHTCATNQLLGMGDIDMIIVKQKYHGYHDY